MARDEIDNLAPGEQRLANLAVIQALTIAQKASTMIESHMASCTESSNRLSAEVKDLRVNQQGFERFVQRGLIAILLTIVGAMILQIAISKHIF